MEAETTRTVLSAMLTKEEKKLMGRPKDSRLKNSQLAQKAELMTKNSFREFFEREEVDLPMNQRQVKKTAGASQPMVLSSISNFLRTLETNMEDPRLQVEALEKWAATYRANEANFCEFATGLPEVAEEPAPRPGSWAALGIAAAKDALVGTLSSLGGASGGGAAL